MFPRQLRLCAAAAIALASQPAAPARQRTPPRDCSSRPESRQMDFWAGEWDVTAQGRKVASSRIERSVGDCVIFESYTQPDGYIGRSINFYDASLGRWRQTWADSAGGASEFTGVYKDGAMRFEGETHLADGRKVLRRMTVYNLGPDRVRQQSDRSVDGGKTWAVAYDFVYVRKK